MNEILKKCIIPIAVLFIFAASLCCIGAIASDGYAAPVAQALDVEYYRHDYFEQDFDLWSEGTFPGTDIHWKVDVLYRVACAGPNVSIVMNPGYCVVTISGAGEIPDYNDTDNKSPFYKARCYWNGINEAGQKTWSPGHLYGGKLVIEEGITRVGDYAFFGFYGWIESFPSTMRSIGDYAFGEMFYGFNRYTMDEFNNGAKGTGEKVYFNDGLQSIGAHSFARSSTQYALIPGSVREIGDEAFAECEELFAVTIGNGVQKIGNKAFYDCGNKGGKWSYDETGTAIAFNAFDRINIPGSVRSIGDQAFSDCRYLESVYIGEGTESIGAEAFRYNFNMKLTNLPASIKCIGEYAFADSFCVDFVFGKGFDMSLTESNAFDSTWYSQSASGTFENGVSWDYVAGTHTLNIEGAGTIPEAAFKRHRGIQTVLIGENVTEIEKEAFYDCNNLTDVYVKGGSLTYIRDAAFDKCERLQVLNCESEILRSIGVDNFKVGYTKFYAKTNTMFELYADLYDMGFASIGAGNADLEFKGKAGDCDYTFDVKTGTLNIKGSGSVHVEVTPGYNIVYKKGDYIIGTFYTDLATKDIRGTGILQKIDDYDEIRSVVKEIIIENGPTVIWRDAIMGYPLIEQLELPDSVISIEQEACVNNSRLHTVTVGSGLRVIASSAFCWYSNKDYTEGAEEKRVASAKNDALKTLVFNSHDIEYVGMRAFCYSSNNERRPFPLKIYGWAGTELSRFCLSTDNDFYGEYFTNWVGNRNFGTDTKNDNLSFLTLTKSGKTGDCVWNYDGETLTITGAGKMRNYTGPSTVPWNDLPIRYAVIDRGVTYIGHYAFADKTPDCITILNAECNIYNHESATLGGAKLVKGYAFSKADDFARRYGYSFESISQTGRTGGVNWYYDDSTGTMTIAGEGAMDDYSKSSVTPWYLKIDDIKRVVVLDGVTTVGAYSFSGCASLTEISIAASVKIIGTHSFDNTESLRVVVLPEGVERISSFAFDNSGIIKISVPRSVTAIWYSAFGYRLNDRGYFVPAEDFVVGGYEGTRAEAYAQDNGLTFVDREKYCFIEYRSNGGSGAMDPVYEIVPKNTIYLFPTCTITPPDGYAWSWWNVNDKPVTREGFKVEHDCIIEPAWGRACEYTFVPAEGGSGTMDSIILGEGGLFTLPECEFVPPDGWEFDQWKVVDSLNGLKFLDPGDSWTVLESATFTALWKKEYLITVDAGVGNGEPFSYIRSAGQLTRLPSAYTFTPPAKGFEFAYWIVSDEEGKKRRDANDIITINSATTVSAMWWAKVIASGNGGVVEVADNEGVNRFLYGEEYTLPLVTVLSARRVGMVFAGWDYGKGKGQPGDVVRLTGPTTLDALWAYQDTRVSFSAGVGEETTPIESRVISHGGFLILPECSYTPPEGLAFAGWKASSPMYASDLQPGQLISITYNDVGESDMVGSLVFTAQYSGDVRVRFDLNGHVYVYGESVADRVIPYGSKLSDLPDGDDVGAYAAEGLLFTGWYNDPECTIRFDDISGITHNMTLYAGWAEGYKVAFWNMGEWVETAEVEPNDTVVAPILAPVEGEVFDGWYYVDDGDWKVFDFDTPIKKDWTLYSVYKDLPRLSFEDNETELVRGRTYPFYAAIFNSGNLPEGAKVSWSSSNSAIVSIGEYDDEVNWSCYVDLTVAENAPFNSVVTITFKAGSLTIKQDLHIKETYPLTVCGVDVTEKNRRDILGDGNISFDGNRTLTLKGGTYDKGISSWINDLNIVVEGNTTFENLDEDNDDYCRLNLYKDTTITGYGILKVNSVNVYEEGALYFEGDTLTIDRARLELSGESGLIAPVGYGEKRLVVKNSNVNIQAKKELGEDMGYAINGFEGGVTLTDCAVVYTNGSSMLRKRSAPSAVYVGIAMIQSTIPVEVPEFIVDFDMQSHGESVDSQRIKIGGKVAKPLDQNVEDQDFGGWFIDVDCTMEYDFDTEVVSDLTLYAKWTVKTYTVSFVTALGDAPEAQIVTHGNKAVKPEDLSVEGFVFGGWYSENVVYDSEYDFDIEVVRDTTLFALWRPTFGVSFDANGGTGEMADVDEVIGGYVLPDCAFVALGYVFDHWSVGRNVYNAGDSVKSNRDIVVKANWKTVEYTITYDVDGGENDPSNIDSYTIEDPDFTLYAPAKDGYSFEGWFVDENRENAITCIAKGSAGDIALYAKWKLVTYVVGFDANGGSGSMSDAADVIGEYPLPDGLFTAPEGKRFKGWALSADGEVIEAESIIIDADTTLFAIWQSIPASDPVDPEPVYHHETVDGVEVYKESLTAEVAQDVSALFEMAKADNGKVEIVVGALQIAFNPDAVNAIGGNGVTITANVMTSGFDIEGAQLVVEVNLSGATFENGTATVAIPFEETPPEGKIAKVYYIDEQGNKTDMNATFENGIVTFDTHHFSRYAIVFENEEIAPVDSEPRVEPSAQSGGLSGGAIAGIVIGSVFGLLLIVCAVLWALHKKGLVNISFLNKEKNKK